MVAGMAGTIYGTPMVATRTKTIEAPREAAGPLEKARTTAEGQEETARRSPSHGLTATRGLTATTSRASNVALTEALCTPTAVTVAVAVVANGTITTNETDQEALALTIPTPITDCINIKNYQARTLQHYPDDE